MACSPRLVEVTPRRLRTSGGKSAAATEPSAERRRRLRTNESANNKPASANPAT
jgi:hypothetical protein